MNVLADDMATRPFYILENAASFAGLKPDRNRMLEALRREGVDTEASPKRPWATGGTAAWPWPQGAPKLYDEVDA